MAKDESPQDVIASYRKRQQRSGGTPTLIFIAAGLLLIVGAGLLIFWLTGAETPQINIGALFASKTPTPTVTPTPTDVPPTATPTEVPTQEPPTNTPEPSLTPTRSGPVIYVVEDGDSLYGIAEKFEMDILVLIEVNRERLGLDPANPIIKVGDEILIPPPGTTLPTATPLPDYLPPGSRVEYTVEPGDSLGLIAEKFNSTVDDIIERNKDLADNPNALFVGQILVVRVNLVTPVPTAAGGEKATSAVTPGSIFTLTPTP